MNLITIKKLLSVFIFSISLSACKNYQENALVGDMADDRKCPPSGCADSTPSPDKLSLKPDGVDLVSNFSDTKTEVSGKCYSSTYGNQNNFITVELFDYNNVPVNPFLSYDLSDSNRQSSSFKCVDGKFIGALYTAVCGSSSNNNPSGCLVANAMYRIRLTQKAIDGAGNTVTNQGSAISNLSLKKLSY